MKNSSRQKNRLRVPTFRFQKPCQPKKRPNYAQKRPFKAKLGANYNKLDPYWPNILRYASGTVRNRRNTQITPGSKKRILKN